MVMLKYISSLFNMFLGMIFRYMAVKILRERLGRAAGI